MNPPPLRTITLLTALVTAFVASPAHAKPEAALDDGAIVGIYNQLNTFDVESALLAAGKAQSAALREHSLEVAAHHREARLAAAALAEAAGAAEQAPRTRAVEARAHYRAMEALAAQDGAAFDRAFLAHAVAAHRAAIATLKSVLLPGAKDPRLKKHFEEMLPHFEHHLHATSELARSLGVGS